VTGAVFLAGLVVVAGGGVLSAARTKPTPTRSPASAEVSSADFS
jgi:hypothetical protein